METIFMISTLTLVMKCYVVFMGHSRYFDGVKRQKFALVYPYGEKLSIVWEWTLFCTFSITSLTQFEVECVLLRKQFTVHLLAFSQDKLVYFQRYLSSEMTTITYISVWYGNKSLYCTVVQNARRNFCSFLPPLLLGTCKPIPCSGGSFFELHVATRT